MPFCRACGERSPDEFLFCIRCGHRLHPLIEEATGTSDYKRPMYTLLSYKASSSAFTSCFNKLWRGGRRTSHHSSDYPTRITSNRKCPICIGHTASWNSSIYSRWSRVCCHNVDSWYNGQGAGDYSDVCGGNFCRY